MTTFQVMLSFISAIFLTLSLFYFLRFLLVTRTVDRYFYFALSSFGCALFALFELLLSRDIAPGQVLLFHRLKLTAMILLMIFWFYCIYEIFFRSLRVPRIFLVLGLLVALTIPFPFFLDLPVRHLRVLFLGVRFDYHFASYGPAYRLLSLFVVGTYGFSLLKALRTPMRSSSKWLAVLAFIPGLVAGVNDFTVGQGYYDGILVAEYVVLVYLSVIFITFFFEEQRKHRSLQLVNAELERQVNERTVQLRQANAGLGAAIEELRLANRHRSELVELAAEGLKDPLQSILGYAELILRRPGDEERVRRQAEVIRGSSERTLELIDELLESSALDSGEVRMQSRSIDLAALAGQVAERFQGQAHVRERRIELSSEGSCLVQADETRLQEIVENLISHAASYSPADRPVRVRVGVNGPWVRLEVRDEGPGLSPEEQERIFAKFKRRSVRPAGAETATGLGLYIVKKLVEMQGGGIGVQSEPGQGTTFTVIFPRASSASNLH